MNATAADYRWLGDHCPDLIEAYCVTLVRAVSPDEALRRLRARADGRVTGIAALVGAAARAWRESGGDRHFLGLCAVDGWTLIVEPNGYLGSLHEAAAPLSRGTELVAHFRNVSAVDHFSRYADGEPRLLFEPLSPYARDGAGPGGAAALMREVGFGPREDAADPMAAAEAAFALAERLTGVRLTPELLDGAEFLTGSAPGF
ncbi:DUF6461 domain-containing protein [Streptomyces sudanensis]|uniref:DUF6461 domain-containing protein n=1 Tax=Streptomyces sudanensis TaxID=436397 RepID=UPI0020CE3316|nr:DUF6461 domain-containing protein [Streptomyces sudanensis]MCP9959633.1 DUF6461 domain-containing protein [Streptomyces sudanensis]MCP9999934.1 DUF6461 domain-containing protein [Streptomyces sudanensis]